MLMEEVVIDSIFAFVARDFKEALDYFYPDDSYPDFAERTIGRRRGNEFPLLVLNPRSNLTEQDADDSRVYQPLRIESYLGVIGPDADTVSRLIMRYTKTYDAVLRAAAEFGVVKRDYFQGANPASIITPRIKIDHAYGPFGSEDGVFFRPSFVELTISFEQR
jgi:hypothetical protein